MFSQKEGGPEAGIDTLVGPETSIIGDVQFSGGLHVDGRVDGSIVSKGAGLLVVSDQGRVTGSIEVATVIVDGTVDGDIVSSERVELREHARVNGSIRYGTIQMALGARVDGELACENVKKPGREGAAASKVAESSP
jgi:cytoskeletal protein CcmA (bactofilin family)